MVMNKASGGDSPLQQGAGKSFWTLPISRQRRRRLAVYFLEFGPLGFSRREEYIGGRAMSGDGPGVHTTWWRGQGVARACNTTTTPWLGPVTPV
jgi:hypothetical protein